MVKPDEFRVAILGASGYSGAELVRIALRHPYLRIAALSAERQAGKDLVEIFPEFIGLTLPRLQRLDDITWDRLDGVFSCLPHGAAQGLIGRLPAHLKVVDLSADFRLRDIALYERVYGQAHQAPALQEEAIYGLSEHHRTAIARARLIANPGCYPTAAQLALLPLLKSNLIDPESIVIDAKSGVSGAGREPKTASLFGEVAENFSAYGIASHRHAPEIEQELSAVAGRPIAVSFTPHLVPMFRGILATIYARLQDCTLADVRACLTESYLSEPFVHVSDSAPQTRDVRGTNRCLISAFADRRKGHIILVAVVDNLTKGASGQAVQNMNIMMKCAEGAGLEISGITQT
ncbi:MAG TPA: N-acetyl-gamma-glutamyl-phosphate reductase [Dongiaceae bacterium]|jgi:N-acetyl-gamma-glutamyl-phosphate reductase|nr:N-acetyl-gamma-glutamyl-phosphate reductase [Dongiaceae bacterium]